MQKHKSEQGISVYLAVLVTTTILGIGLGINSILINQVVALRGVGNSVLAFYAADGGIERVLQVDSCINKKVESERMSCLRTTIDNSAFDDANCKGSPTPTDPILSATGCRKQAIAAINAATLTLSNGASYALVIKDPGVTLCPALGVTYCGESTGIFKQATRKLQISR